MLQARTQAMMHLALRLIPLLILRRYLGLTLTCRDDIYRSASFHYANIVTVKSSGHMWLQVKQTQMKYTELDNLLFFAGYIYV